MNEQGKLVLRQSEALSRRNFSIVLGACASALLLGESAFGKTIPGGEEEISHSCETIHQTVLFKASRKRVYETLTDEKQFDKVVKLSAAVAQAGMSLGNKPTQIAGEVGGAFTLFGGHIVGRHVELAPGERIVQAWRVATWETGVYSIARFQLVEEGSGTKLVFDHAGFPQGLGQHLAEGWKGSYWEPMQKVLA